MYTYTYTYTHVPGIPYGKGEQREFVLGTALVYIIRVVGASLHMLSAHPCCHTLGYAPLGPLAYVSEGLVLSTLTTAVITCKMSKEPFPPVLAMLAMVSLLHDWLGIVGSMMYYFQLFYQLSTELGISLFRVKRRVYCCGVWDMAHRYVCAVHRKTVIFFFFFYHSYHIINIDITTILIPSPHPHPPLLNLILIFDIWRTGGT